MKKPTARVHCRVTYTISVEFQTFSMSFESERDTDPEHVHESFDKVFAQVQRQHASKLPKAVSKFTDAVLKHGPAIREAGEQVRGSR